jgi:hypothetical protein
VDHLREQRRPVVELRLRAVRCGSRSTARTAGEGTCRLNRELSEPWSDDLAFSDPTGAPVGLSAWDPGGEDQQMLLTVGMTSATLSRQRVAELLPYLERFVRTGNLLEEWRLHAVVHAVSRCDQVQGEFHSHEATV